MRDRLAAALVIIVGLLVTWAVLTALVAVALAPFLLLVFAFTGGTP